MKRSELEELIDAASKMLRQARHAVVLTGAGVSTESGIPDFRGPDGIWKRVDPEIATLEFFLSNPSEFWRFHKSIYERIKSARPNQAHYALAQLEREGYIKAVITQNIDGLHQKAGSMRVIELHGTVYTATCLSCGAKYDVEGIVEGLEDLRTPSCRRCGGVIKPDVVLFNEPLPKRAMEEALGEVSKCDLMIVMGSSLTVYPAAYLPELARARGANLVIINLEPTAKDYLADVVIYGRVGVVLPEIARRVTRPPQL